MASKRMLRIKWGLVLTTAILFFLIMLVVEIRGPFTDKQAAIAGIILMTSFCLAVCIQIVQNKEKNNPKGLFYVKLVALAWGYSSAIYGYLSRLL